MANGLQKLTLHSHSARNEWVTGYLVCGKSYDLVIEETVADYLNQTAQTGETLGERQNKRNAVIDGIQRRSVQFFFTGVSEAATCNGMVYSANYN